MSAGPLPNAAPLPSPRGRVAVLIPTLNEAAHIRETVQNALLVGPVFVLDSLSTDGTQEIARKAGATVIEHRFEGYATQKNWGLDNIPFNTEWIFILDADERITPVLREELARIAARPESLNGYFVNRVVIFMGRAVRHGGLYPSWNLRFFRLGRCRYEQRSVHEHMICEGPTDYLKHEMLHIRRESMWEWVRKHIRYADLESDEWVKLRLGQPAGASVKALFKGTLAYRQYLRREVWPRVPFKGTLRFVYMYIFRLGILDGRVGWHLALLMANYEYMITILYREKLARLKKAHLHAAPAPEPEVLKA